MSFPFPIQVTDSNHQLLGTIEQEWSICIPKIVIKDSSGNVVLRITGPCWTCRCCTDVTFDVSVCSFFLGYTMLFISEVLTRDSRKAVA